MHTTKTKTYLMLLGGVLILSGAIGVSTFLGGCSKSCKAGTHASEESELNVGGPWKLFDAKAFELAQAQGKPVILDFKASWCGTCRTQGRVSAQVLKEPSFKQFVGFRVNYDQADQLKKRYRVRSQSTLIVLRGKKEVARAVGITSATAIRDLFSKGL